MKSPSSVASQNRQTLRRIQPPVYPFTAIVGQEEMKLALLLNVIDPSIGGVLIMGHRGTGKSTAVRALADLLPQMTRVRGCFYGCDPDDEKSLCDDCRARLATNGKLLRERASFTVVDLPLGATEDRVCGTINIERALKEGIKAFEPGLLARANRGFLYIDEVNLLEDHLIDLLLDVAVTGRNLVEREGISIEHPARFVLVGSGNPEEGELRPQLIDRFGLHVEVMTSADLDERVMIVEQREAFERDPAGFRSGVQGEQESLRRRVMRARKNLQAVRLHRELLRRITGLCQQLKVDGHRGELTIARAARALAAFEGRKEVSDSDVRRVAAMALRHRLRRDPLEPASGGSRIEQHLDQLFPSDADGEETKRNRNHRERENAPSSPSDEPDKDDGVRANKQPDDHANGVKGSDFNQPAPPALDAQLSSQIDTLPRAQQKPAIRSQATRHSAKSQQRSYSSRHGRYVRATNVKTHDAHIALDATLRTAAWAGGSRKSNPQPPTPIPYQALRYKQLKRKTGTLFIFAIDTSGSMALNRIAQAKGALARLLAHSYVKRDRVALVSFRGQGAEILLPPSRSVTRARRLLDELNIGGATPLAAGLLCAVEIAGRAARQGAQRIVLLLFTDGRANVSLRAQGKENQAERRRLIDDELRQLGQTALQAGLRTVVVDTQNRFTSGGEGRKLAETIGARYLQLASAADEIL
jgi:magnesium chelatase subunit D